MACVGRVKFFLPDQGWGKLELTSALPSGFTEADNANGVFVHLKNVAPPDDKTLPSLEEGMEVGCAVTKGEKGWEATNVTGVDGAPLRTRLHRTMLSGIFRGIVTFWNLEKAFGWISMDLSPQSMGMQRIPRSVLNLNDGRVYFRWRDCGPPPRGEGQEAFVQKGKPVVFQLYWDEKGLGASQVCDATTLRPLSAVTTATDHYKELVEVQEFPANEQLAELGKTMEKCTLCIVVQRSQAGCIIGTKGENVKNLKLQSGADRISVESGMSEHRLVELKGTPVSVGAAVLLIGEHLAKEQGSPFEVRIVIPDEGFGRVVGRQKAQLNVIQDKCPGVVLRITPKLPVTSGLVQAIAVTGEPMEAIREAVMLLIPRIVACCDMNSMPRGAFGPQAQLAAASNPMLVLQQMASMQFSLGKGGGGGYGAAGGGYVPQPGGNAAAAAAAIAAGAGAGGVGPGAGGGSGVLPPKGGGGALLGINKGFDKGLSGKGFGKGNGKVAGKGIEGVTTGMASLNL